MSSLIELNRLLTFEEIITKYGGPVPVWEKLRPGLPVFCNHDGVPIYLESEVDEFLKALAAGLQTGSQPSVPECGSSASRVEEEPEYIRAEAQRRCKTGYLPMQKRLKILSSKSSV